MTLSNIRRYAMKTASAIPMTWIDSIIKIGEEIEKSGEKEPTVKVEGLRMSHVMKAMVVEAGYRFSLRSPVVFAP